jgi:hypothetical protein
MNTFIYHDCFCFVFTESCEESLPSFFHREKAKIEKVV